MEVINMAMTNRHNQKRDRGTGTIESSGKETGELY